MRFISVAWLALAAASLLSAQGIPSGLKSVATSAGTDTYVSTDLTLHKVADQAGERVVIGPANTRKVIRDAAAMGHMLQPYELQVGATSEGKPVYVELFSKETSAETPAGTQSRLEDLTRSLSGSLPKEVMTQKCEGTYICVRTEKGADGKSRCAQFRCVSLGKPEVGK